MSMPPVGFEHTSSAGERPHTYALDRTATGTDNKVKFKTGIKLLHVSALGYHPEGSSRM